jgi:hypothetical protein
MVHGLLTLLVLPVLKMAMMTHSAVLTTAAAAAAAAAGALST